MVASAFFLSEVASAPELQMEPDQAKDIREAIEELCRLYPVGISEKKVAWTNFCFAVGGWAAPGIVAMYRRPVKPRPMVVMPGPKKEPERGPYAAEPSAMDVPVATAAAAAPVGPDTALTPSQMWNQSGEIIDTEAQ